MPQSKEETPDQLKKEQISAEIDKIKAETKKINIERKEIERRINPVWYYGRRIISGLLVIIVVIATWHSFIVPLISASNDYAGYKIKLAEAKYDSAYSAQQRLDSEKNELKNKVQKMGFLIDSLNHLRSVQKDSFELLLKKEKNEQKVKQFKLHIKSLNEEIKNSKEQKEEIENIALNEPVKVSITFQGFEFQKNKFKILLNNESAGITSDNKYVLKEEKGVYDLKVQYKDNANNLWEFSDKIILKESPVSLIINKSDFRLKN